MFIKVYSDSPGRRYRLDDVAQVFIRPFYMKFLNLGFTGPTKENLEFSGLVAGVLPFVDDVIAQLLMDEFGWRGRLTAGVFCAFLKKKDWLDRLGDELIQSRGPYAGQGFALAMFRFGSEGIPYLCAYLEKWLPRTECYYDQKWVLAALSVSDEINGTSFSSEFIEPGGLWEKFNRGRYSSEDIAGCMNLFRRADTFAEMVSSLPPGQKRPPLRNKVSFPTGVIIRGQALIVKLLYRLGIDGQSRYFPMLHRFARRYPLGYQIESYNDWVKGGARKAAWWEK